MKLLFFLFHFLQLFLKLLLFSFHLLFPFCFSLCFLLLYHFLSFFIFSHVSLYQFLSFRTCPCCHFNIPLFQFFLILLFHQNYSSSFYLSFFLSFNKRKSYLMRSYFFLLYKVFQFLNLFKFLVNACIFPFLSDLHSCFFNFVNIKYFFTWTFFLIKNTGVIIIICEFIFILCLQFAYNSFTDWHLPWILFVLPAEHIVRNGHIKFILLFCWRFLF